MRENKGCRTITAPPSEPGSSNEHREDQDPDPKAEGIRLVTSTLDENGKLKKRPKRPKRPKTRPPDISECRQVSLRSAATEQLIAANASRCPNKEFRSGAKDKNTQTGVPPNREIGGTHYLRNREIGFGGMGLLGLFLSSPFLSSVLVTSPMPSALGSGS